MKFDFNGQVILVTGATRGIGSQIADDFDKLGGELILTGTHKGQIDRLNRSAKKSKKTYHCVDFTDERSTEAFLKKIRRYKKIDVCVNNAGINRINYIDKTQTNDLDDILAVNLKAPFLITREVSMIMKRNRYGRIVNISSIFGVISMEKRSAYSMSKFGLRGLTVTASLELAKYNILVNTVSPGFVLTDLTRRILGRKKIRELAAQIPLNRCAKPDEISRVVVFLASSLNTYLTGQNIIVDGGYINA